MNMSDELELLKKIHFGSVSEEELLEIFNRFRDNYRVMVSVLQHPRFPHRLAFEIMPRLFPVDLMRVSKNRRTNPFIREKAELEFSQKYSKLPLGEKVSLLKMAPFSLLGRFSEEKEPSVIVAMLGNPMCTEELVVRMINRRGPREMVYRALGQTEWYKRPGVAEAICHDEQAPIRILLDILPYLDLRTLRKLYESDQTHEIVKNSIIEYSMKKRERGGGE